MPLAYITVVTVDETPSRNFSRHRGNSDLLCRFGPSNAKGSYTDSLVFVQKNPAQKSCIDLDMDDAGNKYESIIQYPLDPCISDRLWWWHSHSWFA